MFDLGVQMAQTTTFYDSSTPPVLFDPTNLVVTIQLPAGTTTTVTPSRVSAGIWQYTYVPAAPGHYEVAWSSDSHTPYTDSFNVGPQFGGTLVSLAEMKDHLRKSSTTVTDDNRLRAFLRATTDIISEACGPSIPVTITEMCDVQIGGSPTLILAKRPVISITSITSETPLGVNVDLTKLVIDTVTGILTLSTGIQFYGRCQVVYVAGRSVVPNAIQEAALIICAHLWETQRGAASAPSLGGDDTYPDPRLGYAIPDRAVELMRPYILGPSI